MKRIGYHALLLFSCSIACLMMGRIAIPSNQAHAAAANSAGISQLAVNSGADRDTSIDLSDENGHPLSLSSDYDLTWHTIDGGGGTSTGGSLALTGTIGQPDAGVMSGGDFTIAGGYWSGSGDVEPMCPVLADLNCDGVVNVSDLLILLAHWGPCTDPANCAADLNADNTVDVSDLLILLSNWG